MDTEKPKKTLKTLSLASFLNDVGSDMILPIWPIFVTTVLGANMTVLGLIDGVGETVVSLSQALSGYLSDRVRKRKLFIWIGYLFAALARIGYAFSTTWTHILPFKILDRSGKIRGAPRDAIIADLSHDSNRGKNFGILETFDNAGAVCGILLSLLLLPLVGYRTLFLIAALPSLIAVMLVYIILVEKKSTEPIASDSLHIGSVNKNLRLFFTISAIFSLSSFSYSFLLLYAKQFGFRIITLPVLYLLYTVVASLSSTRFGILADSLGRKRTLFIAYGLWAATLISFLFLPRHVAVIVSFIAYGLHLGAYTPVKKALVSELAPPGLKASILGLHQMITGLCALPASVIAGLLWDRVGVGAPMLFSLFLTLLAGGLLYFIKENNNKTGGTTSLLGKSDK